MSTASDPLYRLRQAIVATQSEIRNAVACLEAVRPALDDQRLANRLNSTLYAGHAALVIRSACIAEALLAAARLWDARSDSAVVRRIVAELKQPSVSFAVATRCGSENSAAANCSGRVGRAIRLCDALVARAEPSHERLKLIRNKWLAHRDIDGPFHQDGGAQFPEPEFDVLLRCADLIARRAQSLLGDTPPSLSWRAEKRSRREDGARFWGLIVGSPADTE